MLIPNNVYQGNAPEILLTQGWTDSIDLVVTSPPYKEKDGYFDNLIRDTFAELWRVLKSNSLVFLNFGHLAENKARPFKVLFMAMGPGFQLAETFVWVKNHYKPIQGERRVNNLTEFIFMLYKGKMPKLDRLSIGVPYADKSNIGRYSDKDLKCGGNVFYINYETITKSEQKLHNDRFPTELPRRCIKLSGIPANSVVLDPFCGSGTTGVAAKELGMQFIGIELLEDNYNKARQRLGYE